jgi:uncharacterized protein YehS (DUF1456 family)
MESLPIINKSYELYKALVEMNDHVEKRWRYSLGQNVEDSVMSLIQELIMAKNAPKPMKAAYLIKASSYQEIIILKMRLYLELKIANETKIFQSQAVLSEIGRMLGGWLKSLNNP